MRRHISGPDGGQSRAVIHPGFTVAGYKREALLSEGFNRRQSQFRRNWLPESDSSQNDSSLYIEFPFGLLNSAKGAKRLLSIEALAAAKTIRVKRPANWTAEERERLAKKCRALLAAHPALTRRALAEQLDITTSWLNHLLKHL